MNDRSIDRLIGGCSSSGSSSGTSLEVVDCCGGLRGRDAFAVAFFSS
jgi:hypothetical protein